MELNEIAVCSPQSTSMSGQSQAEDQSVCPVCSHEVRLYFINFNEKIEMCGNFECDYPFGYIPVKIVSDGEVHGLEDRSIRSKSSTSTMKSMSSIVSTSNWSDVEKMYNVFGNSGIPGVDLDKIKRSKLLQKSQAAKSKEEIQKNVQRIKEINSGLISKDMGTIKNEKWLKNLRYLEGLSGVNLMKPEEKQKMSKKKSFLGSGELKINIDKNSSSTIKIQINHHTEP